jgi:hypothetical protein
VMLCRLAGGCQSSSTQIPASSLQLYISVCGNQL